MGSEWVMTVPSIVYSRLKNGINQDLKNKYDITDDNFSNVGSNDKPSKFPHINIRLLPIVETDRDLEGAYINCALFTFQITVYAKSQTVAREVTKEVLRLMKKMKFAANEIPIPDKSNDVYYFVGRYKRYLGENDIL